MTFRNIALSTLSIAALATLTACGGGGSDNSTTTPAATTQDVTINFAATAGSTVLNTANCADVTVAGIATRSGAAVNAKLTDLRFYVSNVKLVKADGTSVPLSLTESKWQANATTGDTIALIDMENGSCVNGGGTSGTNTQLTGKVAAGNYTGVTFTLGVPESLNHISPTIASTPLPLDSSVPGMAWAWQAGRKFTKIELSPENATTAGTYTGGVQAIDATTGAQATTTTAGVTTNTPNQSAFVYHLGNTGCVADAAATTSGGYTCSAKNQKTISIAAFNPLTQNITLDLKALFAGNNGTQNTDKTSAGCMSDLTDPECTAMFTALTGATSGTTIFRAIAK